MIRLGPLLLFAAGCSKVPIVDVGAGFALADATWFEAEQTLFLFWDVEAEQGLGDPSVIEVTYTTDDAVVPWTVVSDAEVPTVHPRVPVDCGTTAMCGNASLSVPIEPRGVRLRLRYHRDGELALDPDTVFNVVDEGPAWSHRSLVVYGVFDEDNRRVQWRARHQFPTLRNEQVEELGLRREFTIRDQEFGTADLATPDNPYGYGVSCPADFVATGFGELGTQQRAVFDDDVLPLGASDASTVCAQATVHDATGTFTTAAIARKNPEVRPAFPVLRSPARDATPVKFFLAPCDRTISEEHEAMLRQRLQLGDTPTTCTDDWASPGFVDDLVVAFRDAVEAERPAGNDMVLVVGLSQDEPGVADALEAALAQVVPDERTRSSPRLAGAFVLDSTARGLQRPELSPVTLWCPSTLPLDELPDLSARTCAVAPDQPDLVLGPFSFGTLPILPTREQYLDFIGDYSVAQAGEVTHLAFRTPEFATIADHVPIGDFGVATFLNNEHISASPSDAFSYCTPEDPQLFLFRSDRMQDPDVQDFCASVGLSEECSGASIEWLPDWHAAFAEPTYDLGIFWDFPFLLSMDYEIVAAGSVTAFGFSVPFGIASPQESYYGTPIWTEDEFSLAELLTQCTRFCDAPTFDSAGVYHVTDPFRATYPHACYLPRFPRIGDSGFPLDP